METFGFYVSSHPLFTQKLQKTFDENQIKVEIHQYAYLISEDSFKEGIFCEICSPSQMNMQKAARILLQLTEKDFEVSIPLNFASSPSTGYVNKALHAEIDVANLPELRTHFDNLKSSLAELRNFTGIKGSLILYARQKDFKLLGFSPARPNTSADAWQKYLGKGLRKHGYTPRFSNCWTTSLIIYGEILAAAKKSKS